MERSLGGGEGGLGAGSGCFDIYSGNHIRYHQTDQREVYREWDKGEYIPARAGQGEGLMLRTESFRA